jgi:hypothetical protein
MAEQTQFSFDLKELTTALIKEQDLHEGTWLAGFDFAFGVGMIGPTPDDARPAAFVQVLKVNLVRQTLPLPHPHLTVDAAEVNPS